MHWSEIAQPQTGLFSLAVVGEEREARPIQMALAGALGFMAIESEVLEAECGLHEFAACVACLSEKGFTGLSVCSPFKLEAAKLAKQFYVARHAMGVANALHLGRVLSGQNTEVTAFASKIENLKPGLALIMGSGGAARSAAMSLLDAGWRIKVWNRNVIRSRPFAVAFETYGKVELASQPDPAGCSLIINATPLGVKAGEQPPVKWTSVGAKATAIDFVHRGVATEFLRSAAARGLNTVDGRELLVEQAALALEWWLWQPVPREPMFEAIGFRKL